MLQRRGATTWIPALVPREEERNRVEEVAADGDHSSDCQWRWQRPWVLARRWFESRLRGKWSSHVSRLTSSTAIGVSASLLRGGVVAWRGGVMWWCSDCGLCKGESHMWD